MKIRLLLAAILLLLFPLSCVSHKPAATPSELITPNKEQVWQLVAIHGKALSAGKSNEVTLILYPDGEALHGLIACNRYFADYSLRLDENTPQGTRYQLKITDLGGSDVQCPEADMSLQERYLNFLSKADACLLTAQSLTLFRGGRETLKFELQ